MSEKNEIKRFKDLVNDAVDSAMYASKRPPPLDMPKETLTSMSEAVKKYFYEGRKQNSEQEEQK